MRLFVLALVLALMAAPAGAAGWVGAYVWGGVITAQSTGVQRFYDTVQAVLAAGFDTVRIATVPTAVETVDLSPSCLGANDTSACYARILLASSVWDNPGLKRLMVTAIDRTCVNAAAGNSACLTASTLAANKAAIKAEYAALFTVLRDRFAGRSIQFILSNWEGDNFVYCGSAYAFGLDIDGFAPTCRASFPSGQTNVQRVQAHLLWHSYRDEAVAEFRSANPGFDLIHAPEISSITLLTPGCGGACNAATDEIIDQIAASGGRRYCSYSSYDTQGGPSGSYLAAIRALLTICQNVIIGEAGYDLLGVDNMQRNIDLFRALDQVRGLPGVLGVIPWNAVNPLNDSQRYGLFDVTGRDQLLRHYGPLRPTPQAPINRR